MMHPPLKFHKYVAYGLRVISWASLQARTHGHGLIQNPLLYSSNKKASCVQIIKGKMLETDAYNEIIAEYMLIDSAFVVHTAPG